MNGTDPVRILGIESSCDETAAAIVEGGRSVISSVVASQDSLHAKFRGVVPEIASRAHLERINLIVAEAIERARMQLEDVAAVAAVNKPGLVGSLLIGFTAAKTYAWSLGKPLIDINHLNAHAYGAVLTEGNHVKFPAVALIVSGGHTSLFLWKTPLDFQQVGKTQDDAAGEAFDKVATILALPYPGGPAIDKLAKDGNARAIRFPRTYLDKNSLNFSNSGIKTAVLYHVRGNKLDRPDSSHLSQQDKADVAASFQAAVVDVLVDKAVQACRRYDVQNLVLGGGVAANSHLRDTLTERCDSEQIALSMSDRSMCTDNAAMVAGLAFHKFQARTFTQLDGQVVST